jgi:hypothetical protein
MRRPSISIDEPVNRMHHLNAGLTAWYMPVPGLSNGAASLLDINDLSHGSPAALTSMDPLTDWIPSDRPGGLGLSLDFDGSNDYALTSRTFSHANFTYLIWVYLNSGAIDGSNRYMIFEGTASGRNLGVRSTGVWYVFNSPGLTDTPATEEVWTLLGYSHDGTTGSVYQDGRLLKSGSVTPVAGGALQFGRYGGGGFHLNCRIDEFRMLNRVYTASEHAEYHALSRQGYPGLLRRPTRRAVFLPTPPAGGGFIPYPNPRYAMTGGMQPQCGGIS